MFLQGDGVIQFHQHCIISSYIFSTRAIQTSIQHMDEGLWLLAALEGRWNVSISLFSPQVKIYKWSWGAFSEQTSISDVVVHVTLFSKVLHFKYTSSSATLNFTAFDV